MSRKHQRKQCLLKRRIMASRWTLTCSRTIWGETQRDLKCLATKIVISRRELLVIIGLISYQILEVGFLKLLGQSCQNPLTVRFGCFLCNMAQKIDDSNGLYTSFDTHRNNYAVFCCKMFRKIGKITSEGAHCACIKQAQKSDRLISVIIMIVFAPKSDLDMVNLDQLRPMLIQKKSSGSLKHIQHKRNKTEISESISQAQKASRNFVKNIDVTLPKHSHIIPQDSEDLEKVNHSTEVKISGTAGQNYSSQTKSYQKKKIQRYEEAYQSYENPKIQFTFKLAQDPKRENEFYFLPMNYPVDFKSRARMNSDQLCSFIKQRKIQGSRTPMTCTTEYRSTLLKIVRAANAHCKNISVKHPKSQKPCNPIFLYLIEANMFWIVTQVLIFTVDISFLFGSFYDEIFEDREIRAFVIFGTLQILGAFMVWSHLACKFCDPGELPKNQNHLNEDRLKEESKALYLRIKDRIIPDEESRDINNQDTLEPFDPDRYDMTYEEYLQIKDVFINKCNICCSKKPPRTHHCSTCKKCIARMDHHCPWVGNCIGQNNYKVFMLLIIYTTICCLYVFATTVTQMVICMKNSCSRNNGVLMVLNIYVLCISGFFLIFGCCNTFSLCEDITGDTTKIDRMKGNDFDNKRSFWRNLQDIFGNQCFLLWFLPFSRGLPIIIEEQY
ncbi:unnamed protein product [Moneuplotes crassus]|uniref:Palmitoyltransferase n=1 Tax=Euplotes crassus TaxID=5936 RepID=A0AAD2D5L0_EUPCR|nr:unnamed protein product [Moneuplotes crassus]